jgi:hypothetical protein
MFNESLALILVTGIVALSMFTLPDADGVINLVNVYVGGILGYIAKTVVDVVKNKE